MDRNKPVNQPEFWKQRIDEAKAAGNIRHSVFRSPEPEWKKIQQDHKKILAQYILAEDDVLDAGCGYGRGIGLLPDNYGRYVGVDLSQDFIDIASATFPLAEFYCENLQNLPFEDNEFDWSICISVMIMTVQNIGWFEWEKIQNELLRVSKNGIICLEYGITDTQTTSDTYYVIKK